MALLMSAVCLVANAHAIDNSDIENFFNLSPDEQGNIISYYHYCPVKVDKAFFEIIEIQSTTAIFKGATI